MKKLLKAGIAGAIACSALVGTVSPVSANTISSTLQNSVKETADQITPRFMFTFERTVSSWEFDTIVKFDCIESTETSSGWRIVGLQDVDVRNKGRIVLALGYNYSYYDNYQGIQLDMDYIFSAAGTTYSASKTVKVHI